MLKRGVVLPVGIRRRTARPSIAVKGARVVDRLITRTQEWLEAPDTVRAKAGAYLIIGVFVAVVIAEIVRWKVR